MNKVDVKIVSDVLMRLDAVGKLIENDSDYSEFYFKNQLIRYYYSFLIIYKYLPKGNILDVGSYPSHIHKILLDVGYDADGVDINPNRISGNLKICKERTYKADIESFSWPIKNKIYDSVILLDVIEHLHVNPFVFFIEINSLLRQDGMLLISTPNLLSMENRINFIRGRYVFEHPLSVFEKLERHGSRGHQRLYSIQELIDLLDVFGYETDNIWCFNNGSPLISRKLMADFLPIDFNYSKFETLWREGHSLKSKIRHIAEHYLNPYFKSLYESIFIIARKKRCFDKDKMYQTIKKADPWVSMNKFEIK